MTIRDHAHIPASVTCPTATHDVDGTPHSIIGCGSDDVSEPDDEGLVDCFSCGIWFHPESELRTAASAHNTTTEKARRPTDE
jgi:hypothetical protein